MNEKTITVENTKIEPLVKLHDGAFLYHNDYNLDKSFHLPDRVILKKGITKKDDFIRFVNKYKATGTSIFYNTNSVTAVFNYPEPNNPDWGDSVAQLDLEKTSQFRALESVLKGKINQKQFIFLLKTLTEYIGGISAVDAVKLAENLKAVKEIHSINTNLDKTILQADTVGALGDIVIPKGIDFTLPVFKADSDFTEKFHLEIFIEVSDGGFEIELKCWTFEEQLENASSKFVTQIIEQIEGVPAYFS